MPLILPGNVASATAGAYTVANSYRIDANSSYLSRTPGSEGNRAKWTFSAWIKGCGLSGQKNLLNAYPSGSNESRIYITSGKFGAYNWVSDATDGYYQTSRVLRDPSAWYHVVFSWDSDNGTAGDRIKMYVNGKEETSFSTENDPGSGTDSFICDDTVHYLGRSGDPSADQAFLGYMAEVCLCDGQTYAASDFGEFDEDSPTIWKPKDVSGLTFGTTGFYLNFEDSADLGADASGNSNDFTATSLDATDQATDTPTNNFCTMTPLDNYYPEATFSQGNCYVVTSGSHAGINNANFGLSSGKWYWEMKVVSATASNWQAIGVSEGPGLTDEDYTGDTANAWGWWGYTNGPIYNNDSEESASGVTNTTGDILGCYVDLDNNKIYWAKNGTLISETGKTLTASASTANGFYFPSCTDWAGAASATLGFNFGGSPAFTVSSGNADANGYGNFEYNPSTGTFDSASKDFLAICTKNLAEYG